MIAEALHNSYQKEQDELLAILTGEIANLEQALLEAHPLMPTLLRQIHTGLLSNPAAIHSLTDEQIAVIVKGLSTHTNTVIPATLAKATKKVKATADDL